MPKTKVTFLIDQEIFRKFKIKNINAGKKNSHVAEMLIKKYVEPECH